MGGVTNLLLQEIGEIKIWNKFSVTIERGLAGTVKNLSKNSKETNPTNISVNKIQIYWHIAWLRLA